MCQLLLSVVGAILFLTVFGAEATVTDIIVAKLSGFQSERADTLLHSLLGRPQRSKEFNVKRMEVFELEGLNASSVVGVAKDTPVSDLSFIFMDNSDLMNENMVIARFQEGFVPLLQSINSTESDVTTMQDNASSKRPFIIVYTGAVDTVRQVEFLLREAWSLLDKSAFPGIKASARLFDSLDVQIILSPYYIPPNKGDRTAGDDDSEYVNPKAVEAVRKALNTISYARPLAEIVAERANTTTAAAALSGTGTGGVLLGARAGTTGSAAQDSDSSTSTSREASAGIAIAQAGISEALEWALRSANESIHELNTLYVPLEGFPLYVEGLIRNATVLLREHIIQSSSSSNQYSSRADTAAAGVPVLGGSVVTKSAAAIESGAKDTSLTAAAAAAVKAPAAAVTAVSPAVLQLAEADLAARIYGRLSNIYKLQVQLLKEQATAQFNHIVIEVHCSICFILYQLVIFKLVCTYVKFVVW